MRLLAAAVLALVVVGVLGGSAAASEIVAGFDPAKGEFPEGIAVDRQGRLYVSIAPLGEIRRLSHDGTWTTIHRFAPGDGGFVVLGLAADRHDALYAAVPSTDAAAHGVWVLPADGEPRRLDGSDNDRLPERDRTRPARHPLRHRQRTRHRLADPTRPRRRALAGRRVARRHGRAQRLLGEDTPLGANGIAYLPGRLLVANTDRKQLVEIPIEHTGNPGTPKILHTFAGELDFLDGVAVDAAGNAYLVVGGNRLVRLDRRTGLATVVADHDDDGLTIPASLAFGTRGASKRTLYLTNLSLPPLVALAFGPDEPLAPGVVAVDVPLPARPCPDLQRRTRATKAPDPTRPHPPRALGGAALAIDGGGPDGAGHPNVGLLVFQDPQFGDLPIGICTGSVLSDHLFLTAAHCIENGIVGGGVTWAVTLEPGSTRRRRRAGRVVFDDFPQCCVVKDSSSLVDAAGVVVADYDPTTGSGTDLAVLDFAGHPFAGIAPVRLPRLGLLDHLAAHGARKGPQFTLVGYGAELRDGRTYVPGYRKTGRASFAGLTAPMAGVDRQQHGSASARRRPLHRRLRLAAVPRRQRHRGLAAARVGPRLQRHQPQPAPRHSRRPSLSRSDPRTRMSRRPFRSRAATRFR